LSGAVKEDGQTVGRRGWSASAVVKPLSGSQFCIVVRV
jgi:hypothetical protein